MSPLQVPILAFSQVRYEKWRGHCARGVAGRKRDGQTVFIACAAAIGLENLR
jgi:hypothetical protein